MKIAIISDIHGNYYALQKVIEDAKANNVDRFIFAGDYIFDLPFANEVVHTLMDMDNAVVIAGNKEGYLRTQEHKRWNNAQMGSAYQIYSELQEEVYNYLLALKDECIITLDSGARMYVTHYLNGLDQKSKKDCSSSGYRKKIQQSPFTHEEFLLDFSELINQGQYKEIIDKIDASVIIFGHNHLQAYGYCDKKLVINPGSCGQPLDFNTDSPYVILEENPDGFCVIEKRVKYNIESVITIAKSSETYKKGMIWSELVFTALRTGLDYFGVMFEIAGRIAATKGESGTFFSDDTWAEAYTEFVKNINGEALRNPDITVRL